MPLSQQEWVPVTIHEMVVELLQSERHRIIGPAPAIDSPNHVDDPADVLVLDLWKDP